MHRDLVQERPMAPPRDTVYYIEPRFDGKSAEQLFQERLAAGIARYLGQAVVVREEYEPTRIPRLDGPPTPQRLSEVQIILYKLYDDAGTPYYREPVYLRRFTAEEWNT